MVPQVEVRPQPVDFLSAASSKRKSSADHHASLSGAISASFILRWQMGYSFIGVVIRRVLLICFSLHLSRFRAIVFALLESFCRLRWGSMKRTIDVPNSSRTLIDILRSTLSLVEYYGHMSGHDSTLHELKTTLVQTIAELERLSGNKIVNPVSDFVSMPQPPTTANRKNDSLIKRA